MTDGRFDELMLGMAQKHRGIDDLLYTVMSFYERRTDLFHVQEDGAAKGHPPGKAEDMLRKQFRHFQNRYLERSQPHLLASPAEVASARAASARASGAPASADSAAGGAPARPVADSVACGAAVPSQSSQASIPSGVSASPLEGGDPGQWEKVEHEGQGFTWNQSVQDITVELAVEKCPARDIKVTFAPRKLTVKRSGTTILEGKLSDKINCEESTWHLDSGKQVVLSLEKSKPVFWNGLFEQAACVPKPGS